MNHILTTLNPYVASPRRQVDINDTHQIILRILHISPRQTSYIQWGPGAVFTAMCALSAILLTGLPETKGRPLPGTLEEMEDWKRSGTHGDKEEMEVLNKTV